VKFPLAVAAKRVLGGERLTNGFDASAGVKVRHVGGAPWWIRTTDLQIRSLLLYPTELRAL
jgi:hypothetical protein